MWLQNTNALRSNLYLKAITFRKKKLPELNQFDSIEMPFVIWPVSENMQNDLSGRFHWYVGNSTTVLEAPLKGKSRL